MEALSKAAGCSRALIGEIERGSTTPSVPVLFALADVLGFSVDSMRLPYDGPTRRAHMELASVRHQLMRAEAKLSRIVTIAREKPNAL